MLQCFLVVIATIIKFSIIVSKQIVKYLVSPRNKLELNLEKISKTIKTTITIEKLRTRLIFFLYNECGNSRNQIDCSEVVKRSYPEEKISTFQDNEAHHHFHGLPCALQ